MNLPIPLERSLYQGIVDGAAAEGILLIRIADGSLGKKPFDIFGLHFNGRMICIEVKVSRKAITENLDYKCLETHQKSYLDICANRGAYCIVLVYDVFMGNIAAYDHVTGKEIARLTKKNQKWTGWLDIIKAITASV